MIEVKLVQDQECHWYLIPAELASMFHEMDNDEEQVDRMNEVFGGFRTGGDYNHLKLYAEHETVYHR